MNRNSRFSSRRQTAGGWKTYRAKTNIKKQRKQRAQTADPAAYGQSSFAGLRIGKAMMIMVLLHVLAVIGFIAHNRWFEAAEPAVPKSREAQMIGSMEPTVNDGRGRIHTMGRGETLASVAANYGITVDALRQANPGKVARDGAILKVPATVISLDESLDELATQGDFAPAPRPQPTPEVVREQSEALVIKPNRNPNISQVPAPSAVAPVQTPTAPAPRVTEAGRVHTVASGDTLYRISRRYDVSVDSLRRLNGLSGNTIRVGQALQIP